MDNLNKYQTEMQVSPFGEPMWIQAGVRIKGPSTLKHMIADSSVYDLTPEECVGLKGRMTRRGY